MRTHTIPESGGSGKWENRAVVTQFKSYGFLNFIFALSACNSAMRV
jgi:hypothetical protein